MAAGVSGGRAPALIPAVLAPGSSPGPAPTHRPWDRVCRVQEKIKGSSRVSQSVQVRPAGTT